MARGAKRRKLEAYATGRKRKLEAYATGRKRKLEAYATGGLTMWVMASRARRSDLAAITKFVCPLTSG